MSTRAAIYCRISEDKAGEGLGVARQLEDTRRIAAARGWTVLEEYVDNDISAYSGKTRPSYERLVRDLAAGHYDAVVSYSPDRLARRILELERLITLCEERNVTILTVAGDLDLSAPMGRMMARMLAAVATGEVEMKGARQRRANKQRADAGGTRWSRRPYAYDLDESGKVALVEDEAEHVRAMVTDLLAGHSVAEAARRRNEAGAVTSLGGKWTKTTLRRVVLNPRYAGLVNYNGAIVAEGTWPAVISTDEQETLRVLLTAAERRTADSTAVRHLLSGIAECGRCGARMYATPLINRRDGSKYLAYRCKASAHLTRRMSHVDHVVEEHLFARLAEPDTAGLLIPVGRDLAETAAEAKRLRDSLDELAALFAEGLVTADGMRKAGATLRQRLLEAEAALTRATRSSPVAAIATAGKRAAEMWQTLPVTTRRQIVSLLMDVTIMPAGKGARFTPDQVQVTWRADAAEAA